MMSPRSERYFAYRDADRASELIAEASLAIRLGRLDDALDLFRAAGHALGNADSHTRAVQLQARGRQLPPIQRIPHDKDYLDRMKQILEVPDAEQSRPLPEVVEDAATREADAQERDGRCPDGGYCHGSSLAVGTPVCPEGTCLRVITSRPFTGKFPGDRWPADVLQRSQEHFLGAGQ